MVVELLRATDRSPAIVVGLERDHHARLAVDEVLFIDDAQFHPVLCFDSNLAGRRVLLEDVVIVEDNSDHIHGYSVTVQPLVPHLSLEFGQDLEHGLG